MATAWPMGPQETEDVSTRYRTAFFDAGGVLVCPNWSRASDALSRHGVRVDSVAMAGVEPVVKRQLDVAHTVRSTNDEQRGFLFFELILTAAGVPLSDATAAAFAELKAYHDRENTWDAVTHDAVETLRRIRGAGLRIVVVSNTNGTLRRMFTRVGLDRHVDLIVDSSEEQVEKPDPRLFRIALAKAGADQASTIHCGDLYEVDVIGARAAGLPAVLLDSAGTYEHVRDCPSARSLTEYADRLLAGEFD
jgi:HAD superfamily hydrolase (TIGR01549 family)